MIHRVANDNVEKPAADLCGEDRLECRALVCPEEEGGYSVHCLNLPGVISQGDSFEEAIENITDAFRETVLYYRDANETIPWAEVDAPQVAGSKEHRFLVGF
jgi:predicted RNase H-like HicB family nuclease